MLFGQQEAVSGVPCLGLSLGPSLAQLTPSHRKAHGTVRTGSSLPSEMQAEEASAPRRRVGGWQEGAAGSVPSVFLSTLTHPSKTVSSLQMPCSRHCVCVWQKHWCLARRRDHFIRKILLDHEHFGPKLWAGWL